MFVSKIHPLRRTIHFFLVKNEPFKVRVSIIQCPNELPPPPPPPFLRIQEHNCDHGVRAERAYWTVVVAVLNWLPMVMMTINYSVIIHRLSFTRVVHSGSDTMTALQKRSARRVSVPGVHLGGGGGGVQSWRKTHCTSLVVWHS